MFGNCLAIFAKHGRVITVGVIFYRTAAIILYFIKVLGHAKAEHIRNFLFFAGFHLLSYFDGAFIVDDVSQEQFTLYGFHVIFCLNNRLLVFNILFQRS